MDRIIGDSVSGAQWASERFGEADEWTRVVTVVKEVFLIDEWVVEDELNKLIWIADSLLVSLEKFDTKPLPQIRLTVEVFKDFETDTDGCYLASNLNRKNRSGAFLYKKKNKKIYFISYCAVETWWDFAIFLLNGFRSIGECENLSRRKDVIRFNKCQSATQHHPTMGHRVEHHTLFKNRLADMFQNDFIGGLWISESERFQILKLIADNCPTIGIEPELEEKRGGRNIENLDFRFPVFAKTKQISVFNDNSAIAAIKFNEWTDFGRAIVIDIGIPFFSHRGIFDDGASDELAVVIANILNESAIERLWQAIGFGSFYVKGSQILFSMIIPHTSIKPIVIGAPPLMVATILFDFINPNMVERLVNAVAMELKLAEFKTEREPDSMDLMRSIRRGRRKTEPVRLAYEKNETINNGGTPSSFWDFPSTPLIVYGIFNPIGSWLCSLEVVYTLNSTMLIHRWRHPFDPGERVLCDLNESDGAAFHKAIEDSVAGLHDGNSVPDFIHIMVDMSNELADRISGGLYRMATHFLDEGVDLLKYAYRIRRYPNPFLRPSETESMDDGIDFNEFPELQGLEPVEAYLVSAMQNEHVDINLGYFQSWLEGALAFNNNPDSPDDAERVVENFAQHTIDRLSGPNI